MRTPLTLILLTAACALSACGDAGAESAPGDATSLSESPAAEGPLPTDSSGLPSFRAGLWRLTETRDGETEVYTMCRAGGPDENLRELMAGSRPNCEVSRNVRGGAMQVSVQCRVAGGAEVRSVVRIRGGETAYSASIDTTIRRDGRVEAQDSAATEARWLSACPADMQPGDLLEDDS